MSDFTKFDTWLNSDFTAAIVIREPLVPVEGADGVIFPATYAAAEDTRVFPGGYNIDPPEGEKNVCLIDSIGSQANRIEPIFSKPEYSGLVPQITVLAGAKSVSILEAGHRAGDALVRCSGLQNALQDAFKSVLNGNAVPLAKIAPTSLVFGVWDSRDTQAKLPRLVSSTIRAFNVQRLRRSAQFNPALEYVHDQLLAEPSDEATRKAYAKKGFIHVPATGTHGGVIAKGGIKRDATLSLAALRLLSAGNNNPDGTLKLRRYILGLSLVAFTATASTYLRQGTNLVLDIDNPRTTTIINCDGTRMDFQFTHADAINFARAAAKEFGVGTNQEVSFDRDLAKKDIFDEGNTKAAVKAKAKKTAKSGTDSSLETTESTGK